jgi:hypothetical protein
VVKVFFIFNNKSKILLTVLLISESEADNDVEVDFFYLILSAVCCIADPDHAGPFPTLHCDADSVMDWNSSIF